MSWSTHPHSRNSVVETRRRAVSMQVPIPLFSRSSRRRGAIRSSFHGLALLFFLACPLGSVAAQDHVRGSDLKVVQGTDLEKNYQGMLLNFLLQQADQLTAQRLAKLEAIRSEADFKNWQESNRRKFLELIGGLPGERTPLNARVVGEVAREGYVVRKVIFESLPEFYVTANLYVPTVSQPPFPAILTPCGHSTNGKAYDVYQHLFIGLAKRGYVVLSYDPLGQGERYQYWDFVNQRKLLEGTDNQHAMAGIQEYLLGQNLARYFIWDGIRGLDYLTGLPEVDATRLGVTGNSGGGTLTTYISMLDPRVKVASIVTFITSIPKKIEARSLDAEADPEQDIPGLLASGIDHTEFVGMIAPRPVQIGAATRDFFPIQGTRQTFGELQQLYKKLGVPERLRMVEFDHRHMYSQPLREATYAWFDRWLKGIGRETHEPEIFTEKDETLQCTPTGQVVTSLGGKRVYDFNRAEAQRLLAGLEQRRRDTGFLRDLPGRFRQSLALPADTVEPRPQKLAESEVGGLLVEKFLLETEPGIVAPLRVVSAKNQPGWLPAVLYLRDRLGEEDSPGLFEAWARAGRLVAIADVRGFGETWDPRTVRETGADYYHFRDGVDADLAYGSFFLGRPLLGMRVWDALQVVRYLRARPDVDPASLSIVARGWSSVVAIFAAALDAKIASVAVEGLPASYGALALAEVYAQPASLMLPGVLREFDLQDVLAALAPRPLLLLNPQDALARQMAQEEAQQAFDPVFRVYEHRQAKRAVEVRVAPMEADLKLKNWTLNAGKF